MLLAIYGGVVFFGVMGLFLGPVLAIVIRATTAAGLLKFPPLRREVIPGPLHKRGLPFVH